MELGLSAANRKGMAEESAYHSGRGVVFVAINELQPPCRNSALKGVSPLRGAQKGTIMSSTRSLLSRHRQSFPVPLGCRRVNIECACDFSRCLSTIRAFLQRLLDILFLSRPVPSRHGRVIQPNAGPSVLTFRSRQVGSGTTGEATRSAAE